MSRIGKAIIVLPSDVTLTIDASSWVSVKGAKGELRIPIPRGLTVVKEGSHVEVTTSRSDKPTRALHGWLRASIANALYGVTRGWTKTLELSGVGYRATVTGVNLVLSVGFSHPVTIEPPGGVAFAAAEGKIVVSGIDKQLVGQVAASIRAVKEPEPYKGKGIKYEGEYIRKKAGKAKAVGGAPGAAK